MPVMQMDNPIPFLTRHSTFDILKPDLRRKELAEVAELADAHDSNSCSFGSVGSIPTFGIYRTALEMSESGSTF